MAIRPSYLINQIPMPLPPQPMEFGPNSASYTQLCAAMRNRTLVKIIGSRTVIGHIKVIAMEDGSGRNWNVTVGTPDNHNIIVFIKAH